MDASDSPSRPLRTAALSEPSFALPGIVIENFRGVVLGCKSMIECEVNGRV